MKIFARLLWLITRLARDARFETWLDTNTYNFQRNRLNLPGLILPVVLAVNGPKNLVYIPTFETRRNQ